MKIKFTQGVFIADLDRVVNVGDEIEFDADRAENFISANFAVEVVEEEPTTFQETEESVESVEVKPKKQRKGDK